MNCEKKSIDSSIILDVFCLDKGLPPLSQNLNVVVNMICQMPSLERRKVNRKIRKLCKKVIVFESKDFGCLAHKNRFKRSANASLGFKTKRDTFSRDILLRRLSFLRRAFAREQSK